MPLLLCLLLSACNPPLRQDLLTISGPFEPLSLDPAKTGYIYTRMQVLETLVDVADDGTLRPGLADHWHSNADASRWQFHLRQQVQFHDGSPLNAAAVVNSLQIALRKPVPFPRSLIQAITAVTPDKVEFQLSHGYRPFAAILSHFSCAILAPASYRGTQISQLYGTGPYQLKEFDPPHLVSVQRFANYYAAKAQIPEVKYITGHRSESRALMVQGGSADIVYNLDPASVQLLQQTAKVTVHSTPIPRSIVIKLNSAAPLLQSVQNRQALSLAIDRQGIASGILHLADIEANQLFGPTMGIWHVKNLPAPSRNLDAAKALLASQGWQAGADGILQRAGQRFSLKMVTYANRPELIVIATAIQAQWAELGVELQVLMENASAIPAEHADGSLQTALIARNFGTLPDPLTVMLADFSSRNGGDWGPMNWDNAPFFRAVLTLSDQQGAAYEQQAQQLVRQLNTDLPLIPVTYYVQQSAVSSRVQGFSFDPYERSFRIAAMTLRP